MRAIETKGKIDKKGFLKVERPLGERNKDVKIIILFPEESDPEEEKIWLAAINSSPSFDFLKHKEEDIYKPTDGRPFND
jgi:hypothetical protein